MNIRKSNENDASSIMELVHQAQDYFRRSNIDQWQDGYRKIENILEDIQKGCSYVLEDQQKIIGTMYFAIEEDVNYHHIDGQWKTSHQPYAVIHRIVVDEKHKGQNLAALLLSYVVNTCLNLKVASIRIDTHEDNLSMQRFLKKNGFELCGGITLQSGAPRIGFEKIIE